MRALSLITLSLFVLHTTASSGAVWATPHDSYSSSIGVLGCKINTNRVAYWPGSVDCTNFCVSLSYEGRSVKLLRIDQSGGAHDVSYDAWNYLYTGYSATDKPTAGGAIAMDYQELAPEECKELIHTADGKMPLSAANSMNFVASCLAQQGSWIGNNHGLYNIIDSVCTMGFDEKCSLDLNVSNQPNCSHTLGLQDKLISQPVYNIQYPTGVVVEVGTGQVVPPSTVSGPGSGPGSVGANPNKGGLSAGAKAGIGIGVTLGVLALLAVAGFWWWKKHRKGD
ncbi:hypothetical protein DM02DRAFT_716036 [Periconia macrospinosa]|uniref:Cerato-platanin n=1 Tax=Periconia macrospinosa TaxID=97972 RepID=A0A2V1E396_9PLEO|nr:hypothetical protein DM02DRAFT_716036 [Periconia macrospinosa]